MYLYALENVCQHCTVIFVLEGELKSETKGL